MQAILAGKAGMLADSLNRRNSVVGRICEIVLACADISPERDTYNTFFVLW